MAVGWYVGTGVGSTVGIADGWYVGEGVGFTEKGPGVNLFGNGGEESGDCVRAQNGIPLDGFGVFGAFEGFAVDGFRVGGHLLVVMNVERLGLASFVLVAATPARNRSQRGAICFMVLNCRCDVDS